MLGNVKAFILSICAAVVFTTLLVSANTMAMSIRERTREVAVLKTLVFSGRPFLGLFVGEAVALSLVGGLLGAWAACCLLIQLMPQSPHVGSSPPCKLRREPCLWHWLWPAWWVS